MTALRSLPRVRPEIQTPKREKMWTCVERRESEPFGKMLRNVIFTDLYENEGRKDLIFGLLK